jgi:FKBP-type peptidyl-prolyl cis-trans isomerase FklB
MQMNHPDVKPSGLGIYVLEETEGTGVPVEKDGFAIVNYTIRDLDGNITSYTGKETAKQLGKYDTTFYYGPKVWTTTDETIQAGVADALIGMKAGGHKKVIIPGWLLTYKVYDNPEHYLNPPKDKKKKDEDSSTPTYDNAIYDIDVVDFAENISDWEIGNIGSYLAENTSLGLSVADSLQYGFYYKQLTAPTDTTSFPKDTTIYINYTGKLLSGLVFDTTDERTAKDNGIYSSSKEYKPVSVSWGETFSDIKMGGSTIIGGFGLTLWQMRAFEKGVGIFYSPLGYSYSGSGSSIPGYAPLIFEIEIVKKP